MLDDISETWRLMLQAAAARKDRLLQLPANATGAAVNAIASELIDAGWAKEIKAPKKAPIWRRDASGGGTFALKLTAKGLTAIASFIEKLPVAKEAAATVVVETSASNAPSPQCEPLLTAEVAAPGAPNDDRRNGAITNVAHAPRAGCKLDQVLVMLSAEAGATIGELMAATGWLSHSTRAALTGLRQRSYELGIARRERDGASVYRVINRAGEAAA